VTFDGTGTARTVRVDPPFSGTSVGACVSSRFSVVRVPPFSGGPVMLSKSFTVQ
jgi:hypothetical protein